MAKVIPFRGLRYNSGKISDYSKVVCPPYDIISSEYQDELYTMSEYNVIRLEYGKIMDGDNESENRYTRAGGFLKKWIEEEILMTEDEPAFYIYEEVFRTPGSKTLPKSIKGIISLVELAEFSKGIVLPHEHTLPKARGDRFELMSETNANFSQIYSLYVDKERYMREIISANTEDEPIVSFTGKDDIIHNLWKITDKAVLNRITEVFANKQLYIADGHHRYETALSYRNDKIPGSEYVMMFLIDMEDEGLVVNPTHRLIKGIEGFSEFNLTGALTDYFNVSKVFAMDNDFEVVIEEKMNKVHERTVFALYTGMNYYYLLELKDMEIMKEILPDKSPVVRKLDVSVLHRLILEEHLGIDGECVAKGEKLTYTRDMAEAIDAVRRGEYQCAFIVNPTKISEIKEVSLANEKMPQKSTYFYPKLITGLVMRQMQEEV